MKRLILLSIILTAFALIGCISSSPKPMSDAELMVLAEESADTKVTAMPELDATPETTDMLYIIDDPAGTPVSKKITVGDVLSAGHAAVTLDSSATTGGMSLTGQAISNQAATNAQPGYATAAQIQAIEANTSKDTNATHTGEVTGSEALTIADNIIDESNMHISNAPTNDYVLTADSGATGGWKWSAASSGMTYPGAGIPLSTGSAWDTSYSIATLGAALEADMVLSNMQGSVLDGQIPSTIARDTEVSALQADDLVTLSGVAIGSTHLGTFTGDIITDSSTIKAALQELETELGDTVTIDTNGILVRTGAGTAAARTITGGAGISMSNGDGVSGNPTITVDATAAEISFSPEGSIAASTVQAAIQEVRDEAGGAETNSLESTITGIANAEIFVGDGADSGAFVAVSGDIGLANTGAMTIQANSVENSMMADNSVDTAELAADAVEGTKIADDAVDSEHIADDAITAALIDDNAVTYAATSGSSKALPPVTDDADNFATNFIGANLYGGVFLANGAGDIDLPSPVSGMNFVVITFGDIEVDALPDTGDDLILDGVQLDANHDASNTGSAGDIAVFQYYDSTGWLVTTNGWTEVAD